jgi:hypothetical protein
MYFILGDALNSKAPGLVLLSLDSGMRLPSKKKKKKKKTRRNIYNVD